MLSAMPTPSNLNVPIFSTLSQPYAATAAAMVNQNGNSFISNYPSQCTPLNSNNSNGANGSNRPNKHRFLTLIIIYMMGYAIPWWNQIQDVRLTDNIRVYDMTITANANANANTIEVFRFDDVDTDLTKYSLYNTSGFNRYYNSCKIFSESIGASGASPSQANKLTLLKNAFNTILNERNSSEVAIQYFGHANGDGTLFSSFLSNGPKIADFFYNVTRSLKDNKFLFGHFATNCLEATSEVMRMRALYFKYIMASSKTVGFTTNSPSSMGFKLKNFWGKSIFPTAINPFLFMNETNVISSLAYSMDIVRNVWCLGANVTMKNTQNKQIISLFNVSYWPILQEAVRTTSALTPQNFPMDLKLLLDQVLPQDSNESYYQFKLYEVNNQDFFNWNETDNGFFVQNIANLVSFTDDDHFPPNQNMLDVPKNTGLYSLKPNGVKLVWDSVTDATGYIISRLDSTVKTNLTFSSVASVTQSQQMSYIDSTANITGITYTFRIYAINTDMMSSLSSTPGVYSPK